MSKMLTWVFAAVAIAVFYVLFRPPSSPGEDPRPEPLVGVIYVRLHPSCAICGNHFAAACPECMGGDYYCFKHSKKVRRVVHKDLLPFLDIVSDLYVPRLGTSACFVLGMARA